jgi:hypothetical protein
VREEDGTQLAEKFERIGLSDEIDEKLGFGRVQDGPRKEGWLINMHPVRSHVLLGECTSVEWARRVDDLERPGLAGGKVGCGLLFHSRRWRVIQGDAQV